MICLTLKSRRYSLIREVQNHRSQPGRRGFEPLYALYSSAPNYQCDHRTGLASVLLRLARESNPAICCLLESLATDATINLMQKYLRFSQWN